MKPSPSFEPEAILPEVSEQEVARAWDRDADSWAAQVRAGLDIYREHYNNPAFLEFIGDLSGLTVLDAGCGEGYNTRILARCGAKMTGVDISARMIELARADENRAPLGIRYEVGSFSDLSRFAEASFDAAVSFMALMDGPDFPSAMRAFHRVLKPGGTLTFSITHPCFLTKGFGWVRDEAGHEKALTVAHYFNDAPWLEEWKFKRLAPNGGDVAPFTTPRFERTLAHYLNGVIDAGLIIRRIGEPRPSEAASRAHPWLTRARDHVPFFFYVRAERPR